MESYGNSKNSRLKMRGTSGELRHPRRSRYRCSLPGLAGFAGPRCTEPEVPRFGSRAFTRLRIEFNTAHLCSLVSRARAVDYDFGFAAGGAASGGCTSDGLTQFPLNGPAP